MIEKHAEKMSRQHTIYKLSDGTRVPGCTTITGVMDKPALVAWANGLGLKGIDSRKYVDELATIGTLAHYIISCHCKREKPELSEYSEAQISIAENSVIKWLYWQEHKEFIPMYSELGLVSHLYRYGGTIDIIGTIKGKTVLVDIKTCKRVYGEHKTQVAGGYKILAQENGIKIDDVIITRVGRDDTEGFEQLNITPEEVRNHRKRFLICRELYEINKTINKEE